MIQTMKEDQVHQVLLPQLMSNSRSQHGKKVWWNTKEASDHHPTQRPV